MRAAALTTIAEEADLRALLFVLVMLLALSPGAARADEQLAAALERSGYFTGLDARQAAALRADIVSQGYAGAMHHNRRVAGADTRLFATGGVGAWLRNDIAPLLASRGVTFRPAEDRYASDGSAYSVVIGASEYQMWRPGEANHELASTVAAFDMINSLLQSIGAPERLYLIGQGADAEAWLLTPVQADIIRTAAPPEAWPQLPGHVMPPIGTMPALTLPPEVGNPTPTGDGRESQAAPVGQPR
jgi:hypothetical protein